MAGRALDALLLAGPTASGKSAWALELARRWPVEIVSVDSAQVYRGLDIGTAKPGAALRADRFAAAEFLGVRLDGTEGNSGRDDGGGKSFEHACSSKNHQRTTRNMRICPTVRKGVKVQGYPIR